MLKTSDFKLIFTPIRELLGFSPKLKHIYFSYLTISEIFSWFEEHFCLQILLLLLLLAAIKSLRGVVVKGNSLLAVLILVFCEIEISAFRRPSQIFKYWRPSEDVPTYFQNKCEKNMYLRVQYVRVWVCLKKSIRNFCRPMFFRDFRLPMSFTELFNYFLKNIKQKICILTYNMTEYFYEISKKIVKFVLNFWF